MPTLAVLPVLLFIEDDDLVRRAVSRTLQGQFAITPYASAEPALGDIDAGKIFDAILCDLILTGMSGEQMYAALAVRSAAYPPRFVILTGSPPLGLFAEQLGPRFMTKPCSMPALIRLLLAVSSPRVTSVTPRATPNVDE